MIIALLIAFSLVSCGPASTPAPTPTEVAETPAPIITLVELTKEPQRFDSGGETLIVLPINSQYPFNRETLKGNADTVKYVLFSNGHKFEFVAEKAITIIQVGCKMVHLVKDLNVFKIGSDDSQCSTPSPN